MDGAWNIQANFDYQAPVVNDLTQIQYFLMNKNLFNRYKNLLEETVCLGVKVHENNFKRIRQLAHALRSSQEFFEIERYTDVKRVLDCGADIANELL
jgi:hypothetical protein